MDTKISRNFFISSKYHEDSQFKGDHYVECYAVLDNTVIARDRITVPIDPLCGKDFIE
ncbi:nucleotide-binding domain-containing protein [Streptococcus pneumoniae]|uniref:nucleotide-binding domain-containing protein n=1 Tax=Streptococcus pneumoniae TaxID=1313 RepID=UPI00211B1C11|nr:hypothetical protein [Streptococcus pneumoniae]